MLQAILLALIAGYVDTVGYLEFNAFAGLMTGNTIFMGIEAAGGQYGMAVFHGVIIFAFLFGVIAARVKARAGLKSRLLYLSLAGYWCCAVLWKNPWRQFSLLLPWVYRTRQQTVSTVLLSIQCSSRAIFRNLAKSWLRGYGQARQDRLGKVLRFLPSSGSLTRWEPEQGRSLSGSWTSRFLFRQFFCHSSCFDHVR